MPSFLAPSGAIVVSAFPMGYFPNISPVFVWMGKSKHLGAIIGKPTLPLPRGLWFVCSCIWPPCWTFRPDKLTTHPRFFRRISMSQFLWKFLKGGLCPLMVCFTIMMTRGSMTQSTSLSSKRIYTGVNKPLGIGFGCGLRKEGFAQSFTDSCLFLRSDCIIVVYVDDCLFFSPTASVIDRVIVSIRGRKPEPLHKPSQ